MNMAQRLKNDNPEMFNQVMELKEKYRQMVIDSKNNKKMNIIQQRKEDLQTQFSKLGGNSKFHMNIKDRFPFLNNEELNKIAFEYWLFQLHLKETPHIFEGYVDFGMSEETMLIIKKYIYG